MTMLRLTNAEPVDRSAIPRLPQDDFRRQVIAAVAQQQENRLSSLFGHPTDGATELYAVVAQPREGVVAVASTSVDRSYPSLTPDCPQAHLFEREIAEQWAVKPEGHP